MDKWTKEERESRIKKGGKIYEPSKPKRQIEGSQTFGHVKQTQDVSELHKNTIDSRDEDINDPRNSMENHFSGVSDKDFEKAVNMITNKKEQTELRQLRRLSKDASKNIQITDKDK